MAKVYARLCEKGQKNFYDVPQNLQKEVKAILKVDGYVIRDDGTVEKGLL